MKNFVLYPSTKIYTSVSPIHGRGVFAAQRIEEGETVEVCPVIDLNIPYREPSSLIKDYRFNWPSQVEDWTLQVMPLGYGGLYNHSDNPNVNWRTLHEIFSFEFYALRPIAKYEEILIYYGGETYWGDGREDTVVIQTK